MRVNSRFSKKSRGTSLGSRLSAVRRSPLACPLRNAYRADKRSVQPSRLAERGENGGRDVQPPLSKASGKKSPLDNSGEKSRIKARAVSNSSLFFTTQAMPRPCWSISTQSRACVASPARATCIRPALKRAISVITSVYTKVPRQPLNVIPKITWNQ